MMQIVYAGMVLGTLLFISKFAIFLFLPRWIKKVINYNNFTLLLTDLALGALAAKTLSIADGTIALGASITFGCLSIGYLVCKLLCKKAKRFGGDLCGLAQY